MSFNYDELSYLLRLVTAEADMQSESQHLPDDQDESHSLTVLRKLSAEHNNRVRT